MRLRFLIADDTRFMRKMLTDILKEMDCEVVGEAENGATAVELYRELRPDVTFMDIYMPEMDGIEAMRQIRNIDENAIVIVCSGTSQQYLISDAMKAGANGYVMKPFKAKQIKEAIQKYVLPNVSGRGVLSSPEPAVQETTSGKLPADEPASLDLEAADDWPGVVKEEEPEDALDGPTLGSDPALELSGEDLVAASPEESASTDEAAGPEVAATEDDGEVIVLESDMPAGYEGEEEEEPAERDEPLLHSAEVIPISELKGGNADKEESGVKEFRSSISCHWKEDINDQEVMYIVTCYEGEPYLRIETSAKGDDFVLSFEGLRMLQQWLEKNALQTTAQRREVARHS